MERKFAFLPGAVQVTLERGAHPEEIVPVLSEAARLARAKQLANLLVVSGYRDPASAPAVSQALEEMHALGAPPPFNIAFVAYLIPQYSVYHFAERYAERFGIRAKVHVSVRDAREWLAIDSRATADRSASPA